MTGKANQLFNSPKVDLHIHSERSDGSFTSQEIIDYACKMGLKAISITDHDDIGSLEFSEQYCRQKGIEFISGVEISARTRPFDLHLLGYFFDYRNQLLKNYIAFFQDERLKRAKKIVELLKNYGIHLPFDLILKRQATARSAVLISRMSSLKRATSIPTRKLVRSTSGRAARVGCPNIKSLQQKQLR